MDIVRIRMLMRPGDLEFFAYSPILVMGTDSRTAIRIAWGQLHVRKGSQCHNSEYMRYIQLAEIIA